MTPLDIGLIILWLILWWVGWKWYADNGIANQTNEAKKELDRLRQQADVIVTKAEEKAEKKVTDAESKARDLSQRAQQEVDMMTKKAEEQAQKITQKADDVVEKAEKDAEHQQKKLDQIEEKLAQKEEKLEQRIEKLDEKKEELSVKKKELDEVYAKQETILSDLSGLTPEEAKTQLFAQIEKDNKDEIKRFIGKRKTIKEEEAKEEAGKIIAKVMPRVAQEWLVEFVVSNIDLPTEDMKGKIIWREWRNITAFEKVTGVEVTIDDTPLTIKLSCYDTEKRFVAGETMKRLIKDGRINPVYIEKMYEEVLSGMQERFMKKGKEALAILNITMMKPEIVEMIGRFYLRYSYGQNLRQHSIEVAKLSEMLANELWLDADIAKKAWLLHDIWKIEAWNWEAHTKAWGEFLRKHKMNDVIVNTAEGHHFDVEMLYPEARVVTAADAISASRPGARSDTKELFIERMSTLENLITWVDGVEKSYIMSAWREIMVFFNPSEVDDITMEKLTGEIGQKIEDQLDYPWSIRVVWIREKKLTHFLR